MSDFNALGDCGALTTEDALAVALGDCDALTTEDALAVPVGVPLDVDVALTLVVGVVLEESVDVVVDDTDGLEEGVAKRVVASAERLAEADAHEVAVGANVVARGLALDDSHCDAAPEGVPLVLVVAE